MEAVEDHLVKLLDVGVSTLSPAVEILAEMNQLRDCLFEDGFVVHLDQEGQLRGTAHRSDVELRREVLFSAAHSDE